MLGRLLGASIACLAIVAMATPPAGARGGNHGCDSASGTVFSDHWWPDGDRVIVGYYLQEIKFPPSVQEAIEADNPGTKGSGNGTTCGAPVGTWELFRSRLGPGDDRARLDAVGLNQDPSDPEASPLPPRIDGLLSGGGGSDRLLGHRGFDKLLGGAGGDVIKAVDGKRDRVKCGRGRDKAVVDRRDAASGCERLIVR